MQTMTLDHDICYRALETRDERFDGRFFTGVVTTGVYCRPICPARTPRPGNVRFFPCAAAAEAAGFRPCMRCRPETSPGTPAWAGTSTSVTRALRLIEDGFLDEGGVDELAARLGLTARHLRRLFEEHLGASPLAIAQARRVHFARRLLDDTELPVTQVALGAGFGSVRRFNDAFRRTFDRSPSEIRRGRRPQRARAGHIELRLPFRSPLDWDGMVSFISARAIPGVECVAGGRYRRVVTAGDAAGIIEVAREEASALSLRVPPSLASHIRPIADAARRLFDLRADPQGIAAHLTTDPLLGPIVRRYPGLRVPGAWDAFETAVRAVLGQQISVRGATTLAGRLVETYGEPLGRDAEAGLERRFPTPERLRRARMAHVGITRARAKTIRALSAAVCNGTLQPAVSLDLEETLERLQMLPGVGPWTAHYVAMRAAGEPDAFPSGDLALRKAAVLLDGSLGTRTALGERAERWRPWRSYATMWLWRWVADTNGKGDPQK